MKFSEAIRLGAMLRPQIVGRLRTRWGTCAIGAALMANGKTCSYRDLEGIKQCSAIWPWVQLFGVLPCPAPCTHIWQSGGIFSMCHHLNDDHRWTREQIADWVAKVEKEQEHSSLESDSVKQEQFA